MKTFIKEIVYRFDLEKEQSFEIEERYGDIAINNKHRIRVDLSMQGDNQPFYIADGLIVKNPCINVWINDYSDYPKEVILYESNHEAELSYIKALAQFNNPNYKSITFE